VYWQVRDLLTTEHEQRLKAQGQPGPASSLKRDAVKVDAIVSTIGFPLVGGPAGRLPRPVTPVWAATFVTLHDLSPRCRTFSMNLVSLAGTMEGGRQADVAKSILAAKNVPYVVAAPLLIQVRLPDSLVRHSFAS